ncbi:MAG: hypothetical protein EAZ70_05725 [Runella slithyformis]|nr:MAG: hypothetical protein EAZ80_11415 [Runella slithyformis]TAF28358.1 MAG: hypothetical protein EAZ70_05725 [Runella slithyformis]
MAYSKFTLVSVKKQFGLVDKTIELFESIQPFEPSAWLSESLKRAKSLAYFSEKSRSEAIVMPILIELKTISTRPFAIYSGAILDVDKKQGLNGEIDFILGYSTQNFEVEAPIFCMVEAKDNDIEMGIGQCVAQMIATRILNEKEGYSNEKIYGCVTTGEDWQFMKLEENTILFEQNRYYLRNLEEILGIFKQIIE